MNSNIISFLQAGPDESIVLKYFSLPELERDKILILALEEEVRNFVSVIKQKYDYETKFPAIRSYFSAEQRYNYYDNFVNLLYVKGLLPKECYKIRLFLRNNVINAINAKQSSDIKNVIEKNMDSWPEAGRDMIKCLLNNMQNEERNNCNLGKEIEGLQNRLINVEQESLDEYYSDIYKLLKKRQELAKSMGWNDFVEMRLGEGFYYDNAKKVKEVLRRLSCKGEDNNWLEETIKDTSIKELEVKALEYICELTDLEAIKTKLPSNEKEQIFEIRKNGNRYAWLSFIEARQGANGSTCNIRPYRNIGDGVNIPDVVVLIKKTEKVTYDLVRTVLHEIGHSLLDILAHNNCPDDNKSVTVDATEFYSILIEGLLQDFLESKCKMNIEKKCPLRYQLYEPKEIEYCDELIEMHQFTDDSKLEERLKEWKKSEKVLHEIYTTGYSVNRHSYIIGAALAEKWINHFCADSRESGVKKMMEWFVAFCEKGKNADKEELFGKLK